MDDTLSVLLVQLLSCHKTRSYKSGILPQAGQELAINCLLEAQSFVAINKLGIFQHFGMLAAFSRGGFSTAKKEEKET